MLKSSLDVVDIQCGAHVGIEGGEVSLTIMQPHHHEPATDATHPRVAHRNVM